VETLSGGDGEVKAAVAAVREGLPVVLPTDTVYGLCVNPYSDEPVRRAYELKGRDPKRPSAVLASDVDTVLESLPELPGRIGLVLRALLPGPLTLVVPNPARRFSWLTGERPDTIGVRVPELPASAEGVVSQTGLVMATSANHTGGPDPARIEDVPDEILEACGAAIDAGELPGVPSTVIDLTGDEPEVVREGSVSAREILGRLTGLAAE
jgi:L-threonylcarbamoyladenylate synthase